MQQKLFLFFTICSLLFFSCNKNKDEIQFSNTDILSLDPTISWAVVTEPYAAFRKEPSWGANTMDHCRFGDVLMIQGCRITESMNDPASKEVWYSFDQGWLSESSITVYKNKFKAQKASEKLQK
ncbi:hypothetical protein [Treponema sp.]|uniref:hypothetical protein n=1 Tax=Treponema sp. TaxID=166 RepID=UPI00298E656F|nr:hypothetical protein [Treponema sp.]MCR5612130.1 hypothetical protein [Treponema sp.]